VTEGFAEIECGDGGMLGEVVEVGVDVSWSGLVFFGVLDDVDVCFSVTF
jgi:hypothetical protein